MVFFFCYACLFRLLFSCFSMFVCYFRTLAHVCVCFVGLKISLTRETVLLWPSVFYLAIVMIAVIVVENEKNINTAGTIEICLSLSTFPLLRLRLIN
jgi:hypothetical protein